LALDYPYPRAECQLSKESPNHQGFNLEDLNSMKRQRFFSEKQLIPNVVHFVFGLQSTNATFSFINYVAIASVLFIQRPEKVILHCYYEPVGIYWEMVQKYVEIHKVHLVRSIFGNKIENYAHMADVIRLEVLLKHGGIYLDIDVITLRPYDPYLGYEMVMGHEGKNGRIGLCNAVILAIPNSRFLKRWYESYKSFNHEQWNYHSVILPLKLATETPDQIKILDYQKF
jgi:hypothetical protein